MICSCDLQPLTEEFPLVDEVSVRFCQFLAAHLVASTVLLGALISKKWQWVKTNGIPLGVGAQPILVYFGWNWHVHWRYGILTHGQMTRKGAGPRRRLTLNEAPTWHFLRVRA